MYTCWQKKILFFKFLNMQNISALCQKSFIFFFTKCFWFLTICNLLTCFVTQWHKLKSQQIGNFLVNKIFIVTLWLEIPVNTSDTLCWFSNCNRKSSRTGPKWSTELFGCTASQHPCKQSIWLHLQRCKNRWL